MAQAEQRENSYLQLSSDSDEITPDCKTQGDAVKVNIALFGKAGTGRSGFINAIRGYRYMNNFDMYNLTFILIYSHAQ